MAKEIAMGKVEVRVEDKKIVVKVISDAMTGEDGKQDRAKSGAKVAQNDLHVYAKIAMAQAQVESVVQVEEGSPDDLADKLAGMSNAKRKRAIDDQYERIRMNLSNEISKGLAEVERDGDKIIVRLAERGSFRSGYADLQPGFKPLLEKVGNSISQSSGLITIEGHTDNVPIRTARFPSNWELSAMRSINVLHIFEETGLPKDRITATAFAETKRC